MNGKVLSVRATPAKGSAAVSDFASVGVDLRAKCRRCAVVALRNAPAGATFPNGNGRFRWGRTSNEGERMFAEQADGADRSLRGRGCGPPY